MDGHDGLLALFSQWDQLGVPISRGELRKGLAGLTVGRDSVADYLLFNDLAYQRVLIHGTPHYEALILGWKSGQRSPIHDHRGSACAIYLIEGVATETIFVPSPCGRLVPARSRSAGSGTIWVSHDANVHQMANLGPPGRDLITLHIYSPPLTSSHTYSIEDTTLAGVDSLAAQRPLTVTSKLLRADEAHAPSRIHPAGVRQVRS
jgi:cysteine dioxygenase